MRTTGLYVAVALAAMIGPALAADIAPAPVETAVANDQGWRFQATAYGWASGVSGDVGILGRPPQSVDITPLQALEHLDGAFMGSFLAQHGDWLILTDLIWAKIDDHDFGPNGGSIDFVQKQLTASGVVGYQLPIAVPDLELHATAGFRYQHMNVELDVATPDPAISFSGEWTKQWIDPTIGFSAHYDINDRWFVTVIGDVGGFGVASKITAQGFATIGYNWTKTISTAIGYRAIYTDYEKDGFVYDTTQQGVFTSVGIHF